MKHQKTQNVELYKAAISKFQNCEFFDIQIFKKANTEKNTLFFIKILKKNVKDVCHVCVNYVYARFQVSRLENDCHIVQKLRKCPYVKFSNSFVLPKHATQKDENSTIELPVTFCIERKLFVAKITALKFSSFFNGISHIYVLNLRLTLTSHLTFF